MTRSGLPNRTGRGMSSGISPCLPRGREWSQSPVRRLANRSAPGWQTWRMDGQPEALVDLDAIQANVAALRRHVGSAQVMAVIKSDAYGHGMLESARAALAGGATWLGVV
jgi:hypothetical protein